jgi:hypothetical protein
MRLIQTGLSPARRASAAWLRPQAAPGGDRMLVLDDDHPHDVAGDRALARFDPRLDRERRRDVPAILGERAQMLEIAGLEHDHLRPSVSPRYRHCGASSIRSGSKKPFSYSVSLMF